MPFVRYWYPSYSLVDREFSESCISCSTFLSSSASVRFMWKRLRRFRTVAEHPFLKHGSWEPKRRVWILVIGNGWKSWSTNCSAWFRQCWRFGPAVYALLWGQQAEASWIRRTAPIRDRRWRPGTPASVWRAIAQNLMKTKGFIKSHKVQG